MAHDVADCIYNNYYYYFMDARYDSIRNKIATRIHSIIIDVNCLPISNIWALNGGCSTLDWN